jgi:methionyl-tRNA formyltransferase
VARIGYLGTPELAVAPLAALLDAGHEVAIVVSKPDVRRGRGSTLSPSPVKAFALERGLLVSDDLAALDGLELDLCVVVAFGRIIPTPLLEKIPMVNLHFSLLPRWRGAAPVERAILEGDIETGVCVMAVEPELDTGGIYAFEKVAVGDKSLEVLRGELNQAGIRLLADLIDRLPLPRAVPQEGEVTYAKKITTEELALNFSFPAEHLRRQVALGRAYCFLGSSRVRVLAASVCQGGGALPGELEGTIAATAAGGLELLVVQPEGKRPQPAADWLRGLRIDGPLRLSPEASL